MESNKIRTGQIAEEAWTSWTPTVTAFSGTFTSVSCQGYWKQVGKIVTASFIITITTNGTAATTVILPLPVNGKRAGCGIANAKEINVTGKNICGVVGTTSVSLSADAAVYPGGTGYSIQGLMTYEAA